MPENSTNRGYPLPVAGDDFTPQADVNALGAAVDVDVQGVVDSLSTVATSGAYGDLSGLPTLGTAAATDASAYASSAQGALADSAVQPGDLATVATTGAYGDLSGLPTLGTAAGQNVEAFATAAQGVKADNAAPLVNIGNLFPANVATGTDTLGNTTGFRSAGGGVVIASSTDQAWQGTRSLRAQAVGTGVQIVSVSTSGTIAQSSGLLPVTPGETIHAEFRLYTADTTSLWRVRAFAYSEAGTLLTTVEGPLVTGAASWQICTADAVVPALSSLVLVTAYRVSGADGGVAYLDGFGCWRGAGGSWRPTGQDIADAGTRVKPTDASVVQLWNRSTSSWVDAAASSSVVYGTTAGTATEGNDTRVVNAVQTSRQVATGSGLTGGGDLTADRTLAVDFTAVATAAQGAAADTAVQPGDLATVATTGAYADLTGAPAVPRWALRLPTTLDFVAVPNPVTYTGLTELDVRVLVQLDSLTVSGLRIFALHGNLSGQWAFRFANATGRIYATLSSDGSTLVNAEWLSPTVAVGEVLGLRVVWRADNGSGTPDVRIFSSADEGATWTLEYTDDTGIPASLHESTVANWEWGSNLGGELLTGTVIADGTTVAEYDATAGIVQRYTDDYDNVWTLNGSAWSGRKGL